MKVGEFIVFNFMPTYRICRSNFFVQKDEKKCFRTIVSVFIVIQTTNPTEEGMGGNHLNVRNDKNFSGI